MPPSQTISRIRRSILCHVKAMCLGKLQVEAIKITPVNRSAIMLDSIAQFIILQANQKA